MVTITKHPLGSKYYVLSTSFFRPLYFLALDTIIMLMVGKDIHRQMPCRAHSLEKTLMLGKMEGERRRE